VTKVLTKNQEFLLEASTIVLKNSNVIDSLLKFFLVSLFKSVDVENKEVAIVATDPSKIVVNSTTKQAMSGCFFYDFSLKSITF
jgi:hypothetical protein